MLISVWYVYISLNARNTFVPGFGVFWGGIIFFGFFFFKIIKRKDDREIP